MMFESTGEINPSSTPMTMLFLFMLCTHCVITVTQCLTLSLVSDCTEVSSTTTVFYFVYCLRPVLQLITVYLFLVITLVAVYCNSKHIALLLTDLSAYIVVTMIL